MKRNYSTRLSLSLILLLIVIPLFSSGSLEELIATPTNSSLVAPKKVDTISTDMEALGRLYRYVDSIYIDEVDKEKVFNNLASALIASLDDQYSFYVPPSEATSYMEGNTGIYGGIGTYLNKPSPEKKDLSDPSSYMVTIISPFPGSPAQRAGLLAGDLISHINAEKVDDLSSYEASMLLRGEPNTQVTITVFRNGTSFDLSLMREKISTPTVEGNVIDGDIGYIVLSEFTPQTGEQMLDSVKKLVKEGIKGLIIDERNNSGGAVDGAMQVANIFLPAGKTLVTIQGKKGSNRDQRYISTGSTVVPKDLPIVLLTNGGSASSSEILAAALKDNGRATLIGTKTFGKGIVQDVFKFGEGYAQVTTAHYYTPTGENIHKKGIEPDIKIEDIKLEESEIPAYEKLMTDKALSVFADNHPEATTENILLFSEQYTQEGINRDILNILMRNEYLGRMPYDDRPVGDLVFDNQLKRAVEFIRTGK
ncbi:S41 family peptidase [Sphaerochaeta sp. PS]|uniref:S41 family peptidase n=1 Tax=Sphaerochaeta sp. PS TaxID=3076336 RepID=UPI0028A4C18A|nr:S41 family peptidase [Sphaerochaeta sp. PS]MDT4762474.1 S41 family peptidase [Sphaerochaeta sp. PS]